MLICNIFGERNKHKLYKILGEHDEILNIDVAQIINRIIL